MQHWPGYSTSEIKRSAYAGCPETQKLSSQFSVCLTYLPMTREFVETLTGAAFYDEDEANVSDVSVGFV